MEKKYRMHTNDVDFIKLNQQRSFKEINKSLKPLTEYSDLKQAKGGYKSMQNSQREFQMPSGRNYNEDFKPKQYSFE